MNKIVILDDEVAFVKMLKIILEASDFSVQIYHTAEEFLCFNKQFDQCIYIIDAGLPGIQGGDVIKTIRHRDKLSPIFMVSGENSMDKINAGLNAGADDYIVKPFDYETFLAKVSNAHKKNLLITKELSNTEIKKIPEIFSIRRGDKFVKFTVTEYKIVDSILLSPETQKSRQELINDFKTSEISERTIDVHIHSIRRKLEAVDMTVKSIRGFGYKIYFN